MLSALISSEHSYPAMQRQIAIELVRLRLVNDALYKVLEEILGQEKADEIRAIIG